MDNDEVARFQKTIHGHSLRIFEVIKGFDFYTTVMIFEIKQTILSFVLIPFYLGSLGPISLNR